MSIRKVQKIPQLTGLRYIAAVAVFLSHLGISTEHALGRVLSQGFFGVSFFFVLSGFVLSYSYSESIQRGEISFVKYFSMRVIRIAPLHYLTALPFILVGFSSDWQFWLSMAANLIFVQSWIPNSNFYFSLNAPSWSLSNEIFFYTCFFFLVQTPSRVLIWTFLSILGAMTFFALCFVFFSADLYVWGDKTLKHWMFYIFPIARLLEFIAGMLAYRFWAGGYLKAGIPLSWVLLGTLVLAMFSDRIPEEFRYSLYYLPSATVLLLSALRSSGVLASLLSGPLVVLLGNASFAFYLIHVPALMILTKNSVLGWMLTGGALFHVVFVVIAIMAISLTAIVVHLFFEEPVMKYLRSLILHRAVGERGL